MSALLNSLLRNAADGIAIDTAGAIDHYWNGLPMTADNRLCVVFGIVVDHWHQGIPFAANGRVSISASAADYFGSGAAGYFNTNGELVMSNDANPPVVYAGGVPYNAFGATQGQVAAAIVPPSIPPSPAPGDAKFEFNGVDQYATIPDWTPNGLPFEVRVKAVPLTLDGATKFVIGHEFQQKFFRHSTAIASVTRYTNVGSGGDITLAPPYAEGVSYEYEEKHTAAGCVVSALGASNSLSNVNDFSNAFNAVNRIADVSAGNVPFHGPIYDLRLTDNSPIQDTDVLEGDGTRYVAVPEISFSSGQDFSIKWEQVREDFVGGEQSVIVGNEGGNSNVQLRNTGVTNPNEVSLSRDGGTSAAWAAAMADIALGQHYRGEIAVTGGGLSAELFIDGVTKGVVAVPAAAYTFDLIGRTFSFTRYTATANVILENLSDPSKSVGYPLDEGEGEIAYAYDVVDGEITDQRKPEGPELLINGGFDANTDPWYMSGDGPPLLTWNAGGWADIDRNGGSTAVMRQDVAVEVGKTYAVEFEIVALSHNVQLLLNSVNVSGSLGSTGKYRFHWAADVPTLDVGFSMVGFTGATASIDNVSVRETPHGIITPDAAWDYIPDNSRHYPMDDGQTANGKLRCLVKGVADPTLEGQIQNYTNNWK